MSDSRRNRSKKQKTNKKLGNTMSNYTSISDIMDSMTIAELHQHARAEVDWILQKLNINSIDILSNLLSRIQFDSTLDLGEFRKLTREQAIKEWGDYYNLPICAYAERIPQKSFYEMTLKEIHEFSFHCASMTDFRKRLKISDGERNELFEYISQAIGRTMNFEQFSAISRASGKKTFGKYYSKTFLQIINLVNNLPKKNNVNDKRLEGVDELLKSYSANRNPSKVVVNSASFIGQSNPVIFNALSELYNSSPLNPRNLTRKRCYDRDTKSDTNNEKQSSSGIQEKNSSSNQQQMDSYQDMGIEPENITQDTPVEQKPKTDPYQGMWRAPEKNVSQDTSSEKQKRNEEEDKIHNRPWF